MSDPRNLNPDPGTPAAGTHTGRLSCAEPNLSSVPRDAAELPATSDEQTLTYIRAAFDGIDGLPEAIEAAWAEHEATPVSLGELGMLAERILNLRAGIAYAADELHTLRSSVASLEQTRDACYARIRQLEGAVLEDAGEWVADDRADSGVPELSLAPLRDPLAAVEQRLAALTGKPASEPRAGVEAVCLGRAPITGHACDRAPRHTGWCRATVGDVKVWWA